MTPVHDGFGKARQTPDTDFLNGGGEMGERIRLYHWDATSLGEMSNWPMPLRLSVSLCVKSQFPVIIYWGWPDLVVLYNDAFIPLLGEKHPAALGTRFSEFWPQPHPGIEATLERVVTGGRSVLAEDLLHNFNRADPVEERYYTLSFNPIELDSGKAGGCFTFVSDTSDRVIGERRLRTLRELVARSMEAKEIDEACKIAAEAISDNRSDWPFALFYVPDEDRKRARRVANIGLEPGQTASPPEVELAEDASGPWPIAQAFQTNSIQQIDNLGKKLDHSQGAFGMTLLTAP